MNCFDPLCLWLKKFLLPVSPLNTVSPGYVQQEHFKLDHTSIGEGLPGASVFALEQDDQEDRFFNAAMILKACSEVMLILSDINRPGMSGLELLHTLRYDYRNSWPVIVMVNAYSDEENRRLATYQRQ